jgi:RNA polymerase sigma-70 factor (ECF subfamily)
MHPARDDFPETRWSSVLGRAASDPERWRERFGALCEAYREPIASWLRCVAGPGETVEDLCQGFFLRLIERDVLGAFDPERGRFRHFLKGALRNFLREHRRRARAACRAASCVPIVDDLVADPEGTAPDLAFDRAFAAMVVRRALQELEQKSRAPEARAGFELFLAHDVHGTVVSYEAAAAALGRNRDWVKNHLTAMRVRFHAAVRHVLLATTTNPDEALASLREILAA